MSQQVVGEWRNWAGNVTSEPLQVAHPETVNELAHIITAASQAGRPVKAAGSGHSFTDIAATDGVQLSLDRLTGITDVDYDTGLVSVLGGTSLAELNVSLAAHCLALVGRREPDVVRGGDAYFDREADPLVMIIDPGA